MVHNLSHSHSLHLAKLGTSNTLPAIQRKSIISCRIAKCILPRCEDPELAHLEHSIMPRENFKYSQRQ